MNTATKRVLLASAYCCLLALAELPTRMPPPGFSRVTLSIRDETGNPTGVRLRVVNRAGDYFPPLGHLPKPDGSRRMSGDLILGSEGSSPLEVHAYVYDGAQIDLPPGHYVFHARQGFERDPLAKEVEISAASGQHVDLRLTRFAGFEERGWYPGDTHMHFPDPAGIRYEMECEGLRVCSLLLLKTGYETGRPGDGYFQNVEHFTGRLDPASGSTHFIKTGEEFRHGLLAHLIFQNLKSIVWPVSTGGLREGGAGGWDWPLMLHATRDAHQQGALVTWAHWPYPSLEAPLDIALGEVDSLDLLTTGSPFEHHPRLVEIYKMHGPAVYSMAPIDVYYGYLNCGFHLAASAGSDKMGLNPPMGSARTYVKTQGPLGYDTWIEGIRAGRTFASTYPLLEFTVNGAEPGSTLRLAPGKARISVKARAQSIEPYEVLELLYNGSVLAQVAPGGDHNTAVIDRQFTVDKGGWVALRAHGEKMLPYGKTFWQQPVFAHSSPIYLEIPGTHPPSGKAARLFLEQLDYLKRWIEKDANLPGEASRNEALGYIEKARAIYTRLL